MINFQLKMPITEDPMPCHLCRRAYASESYFIANITKVMKFNRKFAQILLDTSTEIITTHVVSWLYPLGFLAKMLSPALNPGMKSFNLQTRLH